MSNNRDPRPAPVQHDAVPLDDDFFMNISPLFASNSYGFVGHHDADEGMPMDHGSPAQQPQRVSPTVSRLSVDRPSPRSHPYPRPAPVSDHARGGNSSGGENGVSNADRRKVFIVPRSNRKYWDQYRALATWDEKHTPHFQSIFFEKCRKKLSNGWYNLRHARTAEGLKFLKRHEVDQGFVRYIEQSDLIEKMSVRNKENSKAIETRLHMGGAKGADVHYEELEASLGRVVCCHEMYYKLKKKPDDSYVSDDAAEKARKLKASHDALKVKYDGPVPQAVDFEVGSDIIGINNKTRLPLIITSAATLVKGLKFQRPASLRTALHPMSPLAARSSLLYLNKSRYSISTSHETPAKSRADDGIPATIAVDYSQLDADSFESPSSQPPNRDEDEDMESSD